MLEGMQRRAYQAQSVPIPDGVKLRDRIGETTVR